MLREYKSVRFLKPQVFFSSKQFQDHVGTLEEQLHVIAAQRDANTLNLEKCRERIEGDAAAIYNLQNALEQLQRGKRNYGVHASHLYAINIRSVWF